MLYLLQKLAILTLRCDGGVTANFFKKKIVINQRVKSLEQRNHNPRVGGSSPSSATNKFMNNKPHLICYNF